MFIPQRILFEKEVRSYPMAKRVEETFSSYSNVQFIDLTSNKIKQHIPGDSIAAQYQEGKRTLVVGTKKSLKFQSCKPSAHYQLPLVSGCIGQCQYCYLNTNLGDQPFVRVHANIDDILAQADRHINERLPEITIFEGSATSDPIPVEPYTQSLQQAIEHFGAIEHARFRFVTKYNQVDSLLSLAHNGHTEARFSLNTPSIISAYEHGTASLSLRIQAAVKLMEAGYPVGFLIAPVFLYDGWKEEYRQLLLHLWEHLPSTPKYPVTFEIISHRYTTTAKNKILEIFPDTMLPMNEEDRKYKYGQFGYGKYVYPKEELSEIKTFFQSEITHIFPNDSIKYII